MRMINDAISYFLVEELEVFQGLIAFTKTRIIEGLQSVRGSFDVDYRCFEGRFEW